VTGPTRSYPDPDLDKDFAEGKAAMGGCILFRRIPRMALQQSVPIGGAEVLTINPNNGSRALITT
jgi:hypothetical protein